METKVEMIGPEEAKTYLNLGEANPRRLRKGHVKWFVDQMLAGDWRHTHQGIAFDVNGRLKDGQHRLNAVIIANMCLPFNVTYGVPEDAFEVVDSGLNRSLADRLHTTPEISAIVQVHHYFTGGTRKPLPGRFSQILEWVGPMYQRLIGETTTTNRNKVTVATVRYGVLLNMLANEARAKHAMEQYHALASNAQYVTPSIHALRTHAQHTRSMWNLTRNMIDQTLLRAPTAYYAFNSQHADVTSVLSAKTIEKVREEMRDILAFNEIV